MLPSRVAIGSVYNRLTSSAIVPPAIFIIPVPVSGLRIAETVIECLTSERPVVWNISLLTGLPGLD